MLFVPRNNMIILTRKIGQKIIINDEITVTVLNRKGKVTTLGIDAPKHCRIDREEIYKKKKEDLCKDQLPIDFNNTKFN